MFVRRRDMSLSCIPSRPFLSLIPCVLVDELGYFLNNYFVTKLRNEMNVQHSTTQTVMLYCINDSLAIARGYSGPRIY